MMLKATYIHLLVLCSLFTLAAQVDQKLKNLLPYEWHNASEQKDVTAAFLACLPPYSPQEFQHFKAFEVMKETGEFMLIITNNSMTDLYAELTFSYRLRRDHKSQSNYNVGYVELLHVVKKDIRKSGLGSALLRYTLNKDYNDIAHIELYAYPFDYTDRIERSKKLPKLLGFYQRHGGTVFNQWSDGADVYFNLPEKYNSPSLHA